MHTRIKSEGFNFYLRTCRCHPENHPLIEQFFQQLVHEAGSGLQITRVRCDTCGKVNILAYPEDTTVEEAMLWAMARRTPGKVG